MEALQISAPKPYQPKINYEQGLFQSRVKKSNFGDELLLSSDVKQGFLKMTGVSLRFQSNTNLVMIRRLDSEPGEGE